MLIPSSEGLFLAQYQILRKNGHSPSEAFNETVEEATQSLYPLLGQKGYVPRDANFYETNGLIKHGLYV